MSTSRNLNIDMARLCACIAVVLLHTTGRTIYAYGTVGDLSFGVANFLNSATRWCVPVFVMISGALALSKPINDSGAFLWRRTQTILIPLIVWSGVYLGWRVRYYNEPFSWEWAGREVLATTPYYHLYFLFLIAGLYAFAQAFAAMVHSLSERQSTVLALGVTGIASLTAVTSGLGSNAFTHFIPYIGYIILGAVLAKHPWPLKYVLPGFLIAIVSATALTAMLVKIYGPMGRWGLYFHTYFSPTVIIMSISAFCILMQIPWTTKLTPLVATLAPLTLGVYLIHPMLLEWLRWQWTAYFPEMLQPALDIPVSFTLVLMLSALLVFMGRKIPLFRRAF